MFNIIIIIFSKKTRKIAWQLLIEYNFLPIFGNIILKQLKFDSLFDKLIFFYNWSKVLKFKLKNGKYVWY